MSKSPLSVSILVTLVGLVVSSIENFRPCENQTTGSNNRWWSSKNGEACYMNPWMTLDYYTAEKYCNSQRSSLVSIHSEEENLFLVSLLRKLAVTTTVQQHWLGLRRDLDSGQKQKWSDGSPVDYINWNSVDDQPTEHCSYIEVSSSTSRSGRWFHHNCGERHLFVCKKINNNVPVPTTPKPEAVGECDEGWIRNLDNCYMINAANRSFEEAEKECRARWNSDLVSIHSDKQQNFLATFLGSTGNSSYWIGAYKSDRNRYLWKSNARFDYDNWAFGSPNYRTLGTRCVKISLKDDQSAGMWQDIPCVHKLPSLCQKRISPSNVVASTAKFPRECPNLPGYFQYKNVCFKIYDYLANRNEADQQCVKEGGGLASISNKLEHIFSKQLANQQNVRDTWIGLQGQNETFSWSDHTPMYFTKWGQTRFEKADVAQCAYQSASGLWFATTDCSALKAFVCKIYLNGKPTEKVSQKRCPIPDPSSGPADREWLNIDPQDDFCYFVERSYLTYGAAKFNCYLYGGDLPSVRNEHQAKLLSALATKHDEQHYRDHFWIGLHRTVGVSFRWTDGSPLDFFSWSEQEPTNDTEKKCVSTDATFTKWKTFSCEYTYASYMCAIRKVQVGSEEYIVRKTGLIGLASVILFVLVFLSLVVVLSYYGFKFYEKKQRGEGNKLWSFDVLSKDPRAESDL